MFFDKIILGALQLPIQRRKILCKHMLVYSQIRIDKPKCPRIQRKQIDNLRTQRNLYLLNSRKQQSSKFRIKLIKPHSLLKSCIFLIAMPAWRFEGVQICGKSKITDILKEIKSLSLIHDNQPLILKIGQKGCCIKWWVCIFHTHKKKFRPGALFNGKRGGF